MLAGANELNTLQKKQYGFNLHIFPVRPSSQGSSLSNSLACSGSLGFSQKSKPSSLVIALWQHSGMSMSPSTI
jgi:hypothetical protein